MSDYKKYDGKLVHQGADHNAPYPVSRLAPAFDLVDLVKDIEQADQMLNTVARSKLQVIAEQIRTLQSQARDILETAHHAQDLHRVPCNFKRQVGHYYHLYRKTDGQRYFSMLSPQEWGARQPHEYLGTYQLAADMSWIAAADADKPDDTGEMIRLLLGQKPDQLTEE